MALREEGQGEILIPLEEEIVRAVADNLHIRIAQQAVTDSPHQRAEGGEREDGEQELASIESS